MIITHGLCQNDVFYIENGESFTCQVEGECQMDGDVRLSVYRGSSVLSGFDNVVIGKSCNHQFTGVLEGIPAGGPYDIRLAIGMQDFFEEVVCYGVYIKEVLYMEGIELSSVKTQVEEKWHMFTCIILKYNQPCPMIEGEKLMRAFRLDYRKEGYIDQVTWEVEYHIQDIEVVGNTIKLYTDMEYFYTNDFSRIYLSCCYGKEDTIPLPYFTFIPLQESNLSPYLNVIQYSKPMNLDTDRTQLAEDSFQTYCFANSICNVKDLYDWKEVEGKQIFFRFQLKCYEEMDLEMHLGHSGTVKVWIDNEQFYCETAKEICTKHENAIIGWHAKEGKNTIVIALSVKNPHLPEELEYLVGVCIKIKRVDERGAYGTLPIVVRSFHNDET